MLRLEVRVLSLKGRYVLRAWYVQYVYSMYVMHTELGRRHTGKKTDTQNLLFRPPSDGVKHVIEGTMGKTDWIFVILIASCAGIRCLTAEKFTLCKKLR